MIRKDKDCGKNRKVREKYRKCSEKFKKRKDYVRVRSRLWSEQSEKNRKGKELNVLPEKRSKGKRSKGVN